MEMLYPHMREELSEKKASSDSVNRRELLKKTAIAGGVLSTTASVGVPVAEAVDVDTSSAIQAGIGEGYTTRSGETLKVRRLQTRKSFVYLPLPDAPAVHHSEDQQFLLASIDASDFLNKSSPPQHSEFALIVDGEAYTGRQNIGGVPMIEITMADQSLDTPYTIPSDKKEPLAREQIHRSEIARGEVGFVIPAAANPSNATLVWMPDSTEPRVAWKTNGGVVADIRYSPSFDIVSFDVPNVIDRNEQFDISVTARNSGKRESVLRAVLGPKEADHPRGMELRIPAGEEDTWSGTFQYPPAMPSNANEDASEVTYRLTLGNTRTVERTAELAGGRQ